jgi:hypothetical protein
VSRGRDDDSPNSSRYPVLLYPFFFPFHLRSGVKPITLEVPSCRVRVQCPILHANPTEFVPTLAATHMVASFVFFYCCRTTWTFLSVRSDPHSVGYVLTGLREEMKGEKKEGEERRKETEKGIEDTGDIRGWGERDIRRMESAG